jgi:hypothetical protein
LSRTTSGSLAGRCPINTHRLLADPYRTGLLTACDLLLPWQRVAATLWNP